MGEDECKIGVCCCACTSLIGIIVIIASFSSLPVNTWGLDYSGIGKTINPTIFSSGIHFLGPAHSFIEYPTTLQTFNFKSGGTGEAISARSIDGLIVTFDV
jgi:expansin (peptidoglycan-binding protein)